MLDVRLSVAIFSHPTRQERLEQTLEMLGDDVEVKVIIDHDTEGIWKTAMRAWRSHDEDATHHLVLQDDIIPCSNFLKSIPEIISGLSPLFAVSFCDNIPSMKQAERTDRRWIASSKVRHAQALLQPVPQIEEFIQWSEWNVRPSYYHDDGRLEMYLYNHGKFIWHTFPSLVAHDDDGSVYRFVTKGETKPDGKPAYSEYKFIGHDADPRELDWTFGRRAYTGRTKPHGGLKRAERWALGEFEYPESIWESMKVVNHRIWNDESLSTPYEETMARARRERGLI